MQQPPYRPRRCNSVIILAGKLAGAGLELVDTSSNTANALRQSPESSAALSGAVESQNHPEAAQGDSASSATVDTDLAIVLRAWPMLRTEVRQQIAMLARASVDEASQGNG
jgi:hypothetical protein